MDCPKCDATLEPITIDELTVDTCLTCSGIYFDRDELRRAKDMELADGNWLDFEIWKHEDQMRASDLGVDCPKCSRRMYHLEYGETQVAVDVCRSCKGVWLDEGEMNKIVGELEREIDTKSFPQYMAETVKEAIEVVTGPESIASEWRDFRKVLDLMELRLFVENPKLVDKLERMQRPFQ